MAELVKEEQKEVRKESVPFYLRADITQGELVKLMGKTAALEAENAELRQGLCKINALQALHPRAWKLMMTGTFFLVVAIDEPFFPGVYHMIRAEQREKGRWTAEDQKRMNEALTDFVQLGDK